MKTDIETPRDLGIAIRAARKAQRLRQDDAAGSIGVSESFLGKVENGAEGVHWGKLFRVLESLGVKVSVDLPDAAAALLAHERDKLAKREARARQRPSGDAA
jgi:transcriptional regulator with XRE-family HTH domain